MKEYPFEILDWANDSDEPSEDWDYFVSDAQVVKYMNQDNIADTRELFFKVKELADKNNYQIYTLVDGDDGVYWSRGLRSVNKIDSYALIKKSGYRVDNS